MLVMSAESSRATATLQASLHSCAYPVESSLVPLQMSVYARPLRGAETRQTVRRIVVFRSQGVTGEFDPERWHQVARIYELAADYDASARDAFLTDACAGDPSLRKEVESLLSQDAALVILDRSV
jgi:hypothetical protein